MILALLLAQWLGPEAPMPSVVPLQLPPYACASTGCVSRPIASKLGDTVSVKDFTGPDNLGAVGDGSHDDTLAIQAALNACASARLLFSGRDTYKITAALTVSSQCDIDLNGAVINQVTSNTGGFVINASNVLITGPGTLNGPQYAVNQANEIAINVNGTSAASPNTGFQLRDVTINGWGMYGVYGQYATDMEMIRNTINNIFYSGTTWLSLIRGRIEANSITNVTGNISGNAYGIALSRVVSSDLVTYPPSTDVAVVGNVVKNIPVWECYDTHTGDRLTFSGNVGYGCLHGINIADDNSHVAAPHDIVVSGNELDSGKTDGSGGTGISFTGSYNAGVTDYATGVISGNAIRGYGTDSNIIGAAIYIHSTMGLTVSGGSIVAPSPSGILAYHDNVGLNIVGVGIVDAWSNAQANAIGINVNSNNQTVTLNANSFVKNNKSATHVGDRSINISDLSTITAYVGENDSEYTAYVVAGATAVVRKGYDASTTMTAPVIINADPGAGDLRIRHDQNALTAIYLQNLIALGNTSATAYLSTSAKDASGVFGAYPSDSSTASRRQRLVMASNSDATGVSIMAPNSTQDIRFAAGSTSNTLIVGQTAVTLQTGVHLSVQDSTGGGTCTLNGGTPATCTATVFTGARCVIGNNTTQQAWTPKWAVASTTLTITGPAAATDVMSYLCF